MRMNTHLHHLAVRPLYYFRNPLSLPYLGIVTTTYTVENSILLAFRGCRNHTNALLQFLHPTKEERDGSGFICIMKTT